MRNNFTFSLSISIAAACSGASALALEVVWSRALVVPLGNSTDSTTAVLTGFMLGIAGGAALGGRLARRGSHALQVYSGVELILAVFALFVPHVLGGLSTLTTNTVLVSARALVVWRWLAALLVIAIPCFAMGATLPLLLGAVPRTRTTTRSVGLLYGANTLGATAAASFTGFVGIAQYGILGCSRRAALVSTGAALAAALASRARRTLLGDERTRPTASLVSGGAPRQAFIVTAVSGFSLLLAEVLWARTLTFVFGHDTYAFATLLAIVLLGLAAGGFVYSSLARHDARRVAAYSLAGMALTLLASYYVSSLLVIRGGRDPFGLADRFLGSGTLSIEMLREFTFAPILAFLPSVLSGINYPAAIALYAGRSGCTAQATGAIGVVNGAFAALGASIGATGFLPWLGIQGTITFAALVLAFGAWLTFMRRTAGQRHEWAGTVSLLLCITLVLIVPKQLPKRVLSSVVGARHQQVLFYEEARTATVSVIQNRIQGERQLLVNAVNEVTTRLVHDQSFKLLGQLGPLLHPNPKHGVMICLGAGLAAGSVLSHESVERLDVVDLLHAVRHGARYFQDENNHVLDDPRLVLHVNDGRQYLLTTDERFDFAVVDSTHPKSVDSWILYTREFFELLRSRLNPDGIAVQWLPLHGLSEHEFASVVATFASVFPQMTLWASAGFETYGHVSYAKLVGQRSERGLRIDLAQIQKRLEQPRVKHDLERYGMARLPEVVDQFIAGPERISEWARTVPLLTDDRPFLAYTTELSQGRPMTPHLLLGMREFPGKYLVNQRELPAELHREIEIAFDAQGLVLSGDLSAAEALYPNGEKIQRFLAQRNSTLPYYQQLAELYPDDSERLFEAATQLATQGHERVAAKLFERGLQLAPGSPRLLLNQALLWLSLGQPREAAERLSRMRSRFPAWPLLEQNLGVALLAEGEPGAAERSLRIALELAPYALGAQDAMIDAQMALGQWGAAESRLSQLLKTQPNLDGAVFRLGLVRERLDQPTEALALLARAASMNPYEERYALAWAKRLTEVDSQKALEVLQRNAQLYHQRALSLLALADEHYRQRQWQLAADAYERTLQCDALSARALLGLGCSLARLKERQAALDTLCAAKELGADATIVKMELKALGGSCQGSEETSATRGTEAYLAAPTTSASMPSTMDGVKMQPWPKSRGGTGAISKPPSSLHN